MSDVIVKREPLTYEEHSPHSFFADMLRAKGRQEPDSLERLERHAIEMRTNPNTTAGTGGEFAPPLWLIDKFGAAAVAGRVLADVIASYGNLFYLPSGVAQVNVPKITTGASTAIQPGQGGAVSSTDEVTAAATSAVVTIAGELDVSQQLFDFTPIGFDQVAFTDLSKNYNKQLDSQLFNGTNANGQINGLVTALPSGNSISGSSVPTTPSGVGGNNGLWPLIGQAAAAVGNNRGLPVTDWFMSPRRWSWIASSYDTSGRPIATPGNGMPLSFDQDRMGSTRPSGPVQGYRVWQSGALNGATASVADYVYGARVDDLLLFEGDSRFTATVNATAGTLQVRLQLHRYVAFIGNRYPSGICAVTSIPQPTGF